MPDKPYVFLSYAHVDAEWRDKLMPFLRMLDRYDDIQTWNDQEIRIGENWYQRIYEVLEKTKVAVCLISADFLASSFCQDEEIPYLLQQRQKGDLEIFPVLIHACPWERARWLKQLQIPLENME